MSSVTWFGFGTNVTGFVDSDTGVDMDVDTGVDMGADRLRSFTGIGMWLYPMGLVRSNVHTNLRARLRLTVFKSTNASKIDIVRLHN